MIKLPRITADVVCAAAVSVICASAAASDSSSRRVIAEARGLEAPAWLAPQLRAELRGRMARFETGLLASAARVAGPHGGAVSFDLDLFDDARFAVEVQKIERHGREGRFVIYGALVENGRRTNGTALLSMVDGVIQAELMTQDGRKFAIQHARADLCRISEMDARAALAECGFQPGKQQLDAVESSAAIASKNVGDATPSLAASTGDTTNASAEAEPPVVDIMIVYTSAFQQSMGSAAAAEARAQLAVATANQMFEVSEIKARMRLAHTAKVNYTEDADMSVDLWRLADPTDGFMDEVAQLREQYAADVVHLFGHVDGYRRGQATGYPSDYHAVVISGETSLFTHELGHNFGCQHDRDAAGQGGSSFAFGHVFTAAEDGRKYGCVMSYTGNAGAIRLGRFSNPNLSYKGTPTGVAKGRPDSADNARKVDLTAPMLASMRDANGSTTRVPVFANPPRLLRNDATRLHDTAPEYAPRVRRRQPRAPAARD